jgi:hypothetical protein
MEIEVVFLPANTTSILQPMDQSVIAVFKSYFLRRTFAKAIAALDSVTSDGPWQNELKAFWKGFSILDTIKNISDSWEEVKMSTLTGVWKKLIPTIMDDFDGFENSVEEVTANVVEMARELELEVEPEDVAELLACHDELLTDKDLLLVDKQRRLRLEMESTADDDTATISEMTTKHLEHYVGLLGTVVAGFDRINNNFERSPAVGEILSNGIACFRDILRERKRRSMRQTSLSSYFNKVIQPPQPSTASSPTLQQQVVLTFNSK